MASSTGSPNTGDFSFQGNPYEINIFGGTFSIDAIVNGSPTFQNLVNGSINIGDANLTDLGVFIPRGVPEPASLTMLGLGAAGLVGYARKRRRAATA